MASGEIEISQLELADEVLADMVTPVETTNKTMAITLKQLRKWLGSSLPTGFIVASVGKINDERFTLLDGKTLSRTGTYKDFCDKVIEQVQAGNWFSCSEEEYNADVSAYGQCGKFVVSNDYVRIPKFGNSMYSAVIGGKIPVVGNGISLGLTNGTTNRVLTSVNGKSEMYYGDPNQLGTNVGTKSKYTNSVNGVTFGITTDPTKSGIEGTLSTNPMTIYYYMVVSTEGQTSKVEIDINKVYEDLNIKANSDISNVDGNIDYVVEKYINGSEWYRVYKSGWVEQGGFISGSGTIALLKPFANAKYVIVSQATSKSSTGYGSDIATYSDAKTTTSVALRRSAGTGGIEWVAYGQGA